MSVLDPTLDFEAEDSFLHAVLGLLVAGEEIRKILDTVEAEPPPIAKPAPDDAMLYALLGIIRLRSKMLGVVESWATKDAPPTQESFDENTSEPVGDILR